MEKFRTMFGRLLSVFFRTEKPSIIPIVPDEPLGKFVRQSGEYRPSNLTFKETALTPKLPPYIKSVYRTGMMSPEEIAAAETRVMANTGRETKGTIYFQKKNIEASCASGQCLQVMPEESEYRWHCDIHWPDGEEPAQKALRTHLSQRLLAFNDKVVLKVQSP